MFSNDALLIMALVTASLIATVIGLRRGGISRGRGRGADHALNAVLVLLALGIAGVMVWMLMRD
jgi:hypothetical protein